MRKCLFSICFIFVVIIFVVNGNGEESVDFSFVVVSDLHIAEKNGIEQFKAFVEQVEAIEPKPELIVVTGDIHAKDFEKLFHELKPGIPFHVVFGNHEDRSDRKLLANMFPQDITGNDFYSFTYKNAKFIILCTAADNGDHIGHFESEGIKGEEQQIWLEKQLQEAGTSKSLSFMFTHIPPNPEGKAKNMFISSNDQKALQNLFRIYKPTAMFCGHLHKRQEFLIENVPVIVVPSLNWNFENQPAGFYQVKIKNTEFRSEFIPLKISVENK